jgi:hypothetical protein
MKGDDGLQFAQSEIVYLQPGVNGLMTNSQEDYVRGVWRSSPTHRLAYKLLQSSTTTYGGEYEIIILRTVWSNA